MPLAHRVIELSCEMAQKMGNEASLVFTDQELKDSSALLVQHYPIILNRLLELHLIGKKLPRPDKGIYKVMTIKQKQYALKLLEIVSDYVNHLEIEHLVLHTKTVKRARSLFVTFERD